MRRTGIGNTVIRWAVGLCLIASCTENSGVEPVPGALDFPVAVEILDLNPADADPAPTHMLVANTNFDLAHNGATLQSYDLAAVESAIATECVGLDGERCSVVPVESGESSGTRGTVKVVAVPGLLASEVVIGSFAEGIGVSPDLRRVYLPVRADEDLTTVDIDANGVLSCGGEKACDTTHRSTDRSIADERDLTLPNEPLDVHVGSAADFDMPASMGHYITVAHRSGALSFFAVPDGATQPVLTDVATYSSATFPTIAFDPEQKRFWAPTGNGGLFVRASVSLDATSQDLRRAEWLRAPSISITDVDLGTSSASIREVRFDPRVGTSNEGRFYAVALRPTALLSGRVEPGTNLMALDAILPLGTQPARSAIVELGGRLLAFVSCYASREIYIYDLDHSRLLTIARGMSGPFEIAVDTVRERLIVVDFRVSVLRFFDLGPLLDCLGTTTTPATEPTCAPSMIGMLGIPSTVEELR